MQMLYNANLFSIYNIFTFPAFQQKFQSQKARRKAKKVTVKGNEKNTAQPKGTMTKLYSVLFDSIVSIFNNYN